MPDYKTINKELYLEIFNAFVSDINSEYIPLDLGFCAFTVGIFEIVCVDLTLTPGHDINSHLVSVSCDGLEILLRDAFGSLRALMKVMDSFNTSLQKLRVILGEANDAYQKSMKMKYDSWRDTGGVELMEFLNLTDSEYMNYIINEY